MISDVLMPQMGLEVNEATVLEVFVRIRDQVAAEAPMFELETDKAIAEVVAPRAGFVTAVDAHAGEVVAVGARLAAIGDTPDEDDDGDGAVSPSVAPVPRDMARPAADPAAPGVALATRPRLLVGPVARRAADDLGVTLGDVVGSGPRGRVTLRDVEAAAAGSAVGGASGDARVAAVAAASAPAVVPLSGLRRAIARRMTASQLIPQYFLRREVDATYLLAQKDAQATTPASPRTGVNDLLIQAIGEMIVRHPILATAFVDGSEPAVRRHDDVGVGLAVATDRGLVVPVLRRVPQSGLRELAAERTALVAAARDGRLSLEQMSGGTITLSNLGGFGVDRFTAMLNPGQSAILAVGRTNDYVVPRGRGVAVVPVLTLTVTFDHRLIDSAVGGAALAGLAELLEGGMTWRP